MKDITIKKSSIYRELLFFGILFILAFLTNVYAIVVHDGQWGELFTQLHIVIALTIVYYVLLVIIRLIVHGVLSLVNRIKATA